MMQRAIFVSTVLILAIAASALANPLEITNIEVHRVGVNLPTIDEKYLQDNSDRLLLSGWEEAFYGELGWEVFCRLDTGAVDIVFVIDSTGSMYSTISQVRSNISSLISALDAAGYDYRLGAVTYGDGRNVWDFDAGTPGFQMTSNATLFVNPPYLANVDAYGGADGPEQSLSAIADAINVYDWRPHALRILIGFTDAAYCQRGDGCTGWCNPGAACAFCSHTGPENWRDTEVAALIASTGSILFWASPTSVYAGCASFSTPVPWSPYGGAGHVGWYQHFANVSGGQWYNLYSMSWSDLFDDVAALISEFMT
ncbi:MAG TPA: VWA domain-containing protein, partial [candidate division Zixibacteria bacterium]|nr:VWA domain-containing protein [candidate division Zixibacteria bacterium]